MSYLILPLMGVVGYVAVHHLWLWLGQRREGLHLWVAGWSANTLLYLLGHYVQISSERAESVVLGGRLAWLSAILLIVLMIGLCHALAGRPLSRPAMAAVVAVNAALLALVWLTELVVTPGTRVRTDLLWGSYPAPVLGPLVPALAPYLLLVIVYGLVVVWRGGRLDRAERRAILAGFTVYALLAMNDFLIVAGLIRSVRVFDFAFVAVALGLTYMLVRRHNRLHAGLHEEVTARTRDLQARQGELERANRALDALVGAGQVVMAGLDLQTTLKRIMEEASRIAGTPHIKVLLVDREAGALHPVAVSGGPVPPGFTVPMGTSYSGTVATTGEPLFVGDTQNDPRNLLAQRDREHGIVTFLGLPIKTRGEVLGVLTFNTESPYEYGVDELAVLSSFADQAAVAIDNARLYEAEGAARREAELALAQIKQLQGLLPICAWCKRIRDDENRWHQLEVYITRRSEATFSHGICPDCRQNMRKDMVRRPAGPDQGA